MGRKTKAQIQAELDTLKAAGGTASTVDTSSLEFRDAVAKVATDVVANLKDKLLAGREAAGTAGNDDGWMKSLAMEISQLNDQGTGRTRVAPEILRQRKQAHDEMLDLLVANRAQNKIATYRLTNKVHLANRLIEPMWIDKDHTSKPTEIDWAGIPNEAMIPVNDVAKEVFALYKLSIGSVEKVVPAETLGMTAGGLVVRNGAVTNDASRRAALEASQVGDGASDDGLRIHHTNEPGRYKSVNVLGTIQEPARQSI